MNDGRAWRSWYGRPWRRLRDAHLEREPLCRMCRDTGRDVLATAVDHIRPHRGDRALFLDSSNLQSLCSTCHNSVKQAQEKSGVVRGCDRDGRPLDPGHHWLRG